MLRDYHLEGLSHTERLYSWHGHRTLVPRAKPQMGWVGHRRREWGGYPLPASVLGSPQSPPALAGCWQGVLWMQFAVYLCIRTKAGHMFSPAFPISPVWTTFQGHLYRCVCHPCFQAHRPGHVHAHHIIHTARRFYFNRFTPNMRHKPEQSPGRSKTELPCVAEPFRTSHLVSLHFFYFQKCPADHVKGKSPPTDVFSCPSCELRLKSFLKYYYKILKWRQSAGGHSYLQSPRLGASWGPQWATHQPFLLRNGGTIAMGSQLQGGGPASVPQPP